jgi:hypothetical protein
LLPGQEPLISQISRRINGELKPEVAEYTRLCDHRLVHASSGLQVITSLLLYAFASDRRVVVLHQCDEPAAC